MRRLCKGVESVAQNQFSGGNMYQEYSICQLLFQYGGPHWDQWNENARLTLVRSQQAEGNWINRRDWYFSEGESLYCTSFSLLILEAYYRHHRVHHERGQ